MDEAARESSFSCRGSMDEPRNAGVQQLRNADRDTSKACVHLFIALLSRLVCLFNAQMNARAVIMLLHPLAPLISPYWTGRRLEREFGQFLNFLSLLIAGTAFAIRIDDNESFLESQRADLGPKPLRGSLSLDDVAPSRVCRGRDSIRRRRRYL